MESFKPEIGESYFTIIWQSELKIIEYVYEDNFFDKINRFHGFVFRTHEEAETAIENCDKNFIKRILNTPQYKEMLATFHVPTT